MAVHRVTLTFNGSNWVKILARWKSEAAYKDWVKQQTFDCLVPPPMADMYTSEFVD